MYILKNIKKIMSKIELCVKELSKKYYLIELKTEHIKATLKKGILKVKTLKGDDPERKLYILFKENEWTVISFTLSSDTPKYKDRPDIGLAKHITPEDYNWKIFSD